MYFCGFVLVLLERGLGDILLDWLLWGCWIGSWLFYFFLSMSSSWLALGSRGSLTIFFLTHEPQGPFSFSQDCFPQRAKTKESGTVELKSQLFRFTPGICILFLLVEADSLTAYFRRQEWVLSMSSIPFLGNGVRWLLQCWSAPSCSLCFSPSWIKTMPRCCCW